MKSRRMVMRAAVETLELRQLLAAPVLSAIDDINDAPAGKPVIIPLHSTDTDPVTYTVTSSNPDIRIEEHTGNPYLQMNVSYNNGSTGTLVFQLLEDIAPKTVDIIRNFVQTGFYDGLTFHRIANLQSASDPAYIVQGGDPQGTGSGGPGFQFEDEASLDAMFTGKGQLAMANSGDDTNGSQFFITDAPVRHLDLIHTIFGQLVSGFSTLTALTQVNRDSNDKPTSTVTISSATMIEDTQDAVITVWCPQGASGDISVQASDGVGATFTTFHVKGVKDNHNEQPIMKALPDRLTAAPGHTIAIPFKALDWENDSVTFSASLSTYSGIRGEFIGKTLYLKTEKAFSGKFTVTLSVTPPGATSPTDSEKIIIGVGDKPLKNLTATNPRTGDGQNSEMTVATFKDSDPTGKTKNWSAEIRWGDGSTTTSATITKDANGLFSVKGTHTFKNLGSSHYTVIVTGDKGAWGIAEGLIRIRDAALTATPTETMVGKPGVELTSVALATFTSADATPTLSDYTATINWGDNSPESTGTITQSSTGNIFTVKGTHTYANAGSYEVVVTITSSQGASAVARPKIYIALPTLTVNLAAEATSHEGDTYTTSGSFTDALGTSWTAKVDYGDGDGLKTLTLADDKTFNLSHKYADSGIYTITVIVFDQNGKAGYATQTVDVLNVAPTVTTLTVDKSTVVVGQTVTVTYAAVDVSPSDTTAGFTYIFNWGDNSSDTTITPSSTTKPTHVYAAKGSYTITVTVKDQDQLPTGSKTTTVTVEDAQLAADPDKSSLQALYIGGTDGNDTITVAPHEGGGFTVTRGGTSLGDFNPTGMIVVYGGAGNDTITINPAITKSCRIYGGAGADTISGGAGDDMILGEAGADSITGLGGNDIILGGDDLDTLIGGDGRDILIGNNGVDSLLGGAGDDILIGASTDFDAIPASLLLIQKEWVQTDVSYANRAAHVKGTTGGENKKKYFNSDTYHDDFTIDVLKGENGSDLFYAGLYSGYLDTTDKTTKEILGVTPS